MNTPESTEEQAKSKGTLIVCWAIGITIVLIILIVFGIILNLLA